MLVNFPPTNVIIPSAIACPTSLSMCTCLEVFEFIVDMFRQRYNTIYMTLPNRPIAVTDG